MKKDHPVKGRCLCGNVQFDIAELARDVVMCHCKQCRQQTGHMVAATNVKNAKLKIHGEEHLNWFAASEDAKRGFCKNCGSLLFWKKNNADNTSVMAGSLEEPTGLETVCHIYTAYKGDYYEITDGLPQHEMSD